MNTQNTLAEFSETDLIINKDGSVYHLGLRPEQLADTIITVGDPQRVAKVSAFFDEITEQVHRREFITHTGFYKKKRITVLSTGMGTDNIEILMHELDALANIDLSNRRLKNEHKSLEIIRIGTSGSMQTSIPVGTELASAIGIGLDNLMCFYELPQSEWQSRICQELREKLALPFPLFMAPASAKLLKKVAYDMIQGQTVSCPGFYAPQGRSVRVSAKYPDLLLQMSDFRAENDFYLTNFEMETSAYYALGQLLGHEMLSLNMIVANRISKEFLTDYESAMKALIQKTLDRIVA
jgi:uridine phosphorylase